MTAYLITTGIVFALAVIGLARTQVGETGKPMTAARLAIYCVIYTALTAWAIALLVACGGDVTEPASSRTTTSVDCKTAAWDQCA